MLPERHRQAEVKNERQIVCIEGMSKARAFHRLRMRAALVMVERYAGRCANEEHHSPNLCVVLTKGQT